MAYNQNETQKTTSSFPDFYLLELVLFFVFLILGLFTIFKQPNDFMYLVLGFMGYVFFIVDRRTIIYLSKSTNIFEVKTKALFRKLYKIKTQIPLSTISAACVYAHTYYDMKKNV